jgi:hypothetical protein
LNKAVMQNQMQQEEEEEQQVGSPADQEDMEDPEDVDDDEFEASGNSSMGLRRQGGMMKQRNGHRYEYEDQLGWRD